MPTFLPAYGPTEGPLDFPRPDRQARQLDTLLKSLPKTKEHAYRKAVTAKVHTELNRGERSEGLAEVIDRALVEEPEVPFKTAAAFKEALETAL